MPEAAIPEATVLEAAAHWRAIDLISDIHLSAEDRRTRGAWHRYMTSTRADAVFILGDLFEVWVGDDAVETDSFLLECSETLRATARRRAVYFMPGNRDFLIGSTFCNACGITKIADPVVLSFLGNRLLLSHGDALCQDDIAYQNFRSEVRSPQWQHAFLSKTLPKRLELARDMRARSEASKSAHPGRLVDVDRAQSIAWMTATQTTTLVHGHTHRPGMHPLDSFRNRIVLTDWDASALPPRGEALRLSADGIARVPLSDV